MDLNLIAQYVARALALLISIPVHEAAHAYVSWKLGDPTAKNYGRLTLNPVKHFDLFGALCMILVGFGWAKPVPIMAQSRFKNPKRDMALSALAGPVSNIILAFLFMVIFRVYYYTIYYPYLATSTITDYSSDWPTFISNILITIISVNIVLAVFNLMPIPPLDGSRIFLIFLPKDIYFLIMRYDKYIMIALFAALYMGVLSGPINFFVNIFYDFLFMATGFLDIIFMSMYT